MQWQFFQPRVGKCCILGMEKFPMLWDRKMKKMRNKNPEKKIEHFFILHAKNPVFSPPYSEKRKNKTNHEGSICVPETTWKKEKSPSFTICGIEKAKKVKHKLLFLAFILFFCENVDR